MISKAKWLAKEANLRFKYMASRDCIFCKMVKGEQRTNFLYQDKDVVAFADINPVAKTHILIVPKKHIESVMTIDDADSSQLVAMHKAAQNLVKKSGLDSFRLAYNGGKYQHVGHLHMHLLAGGSVKWEKL